MNGLLEVLHKYNLNNGFILTYDHEEQRIIDEKNICNVCMEMVVYRRIVKC